MSREKIDLLRAYGAKVIVTPTAVDQGRPAALQRQVAKRIAEETPGGWYAGQFENQANPEVHYATTAKRNLGADGRQDHALLRGRGHGRHDQRRRALPERAQPGRSKSSCATRWAACMPVLQGQKRQAPVNRQYTVEGIGLDYIPGTISFSTSTTWCP
jgi:cystathionine beta-synthase